MKFGQKILEAKRKVIDYGVAIVLVYIKRINKQFFISGKYQARDVRDYSGIVIWAFFGLWQGHVLSLAGLFLANPSLPVFLFSALELKEDLKYAFILLEVGWTWCHWIVCMTYITSSLGFFSVTSFWLSQIW